MRLNRYFGVLRNYFLLILIIGVPGLVEGQGTRSIEEDWKQAEEKAQIYLKNHPSRIKMTVETRATENDEWKFYSYQEIEQLPPDRTHIRYQKGYYDEVITIGKTSYSRRPFGLWVTKTRDDQEPSVATVRYLSKTERNFSTIGGHSPSSEAITGFQIVSKTEVLNLANGIVDNVPSTFHWWFGEDGRFRRFQSVNFTSSAPGPRFIRTTRDYEYDPNIKIEAPIN